MPIPKNVLFIDDEKPVLNSIRRFFRNESFKCYFAENYEEMLQFLEEEITFHVVVSDMRMPGPGGIEILKYFYENSPQTYRVALTAYSQPAQILAAINHGHVNKYFLKPLKFDTELKKVINNHLDSLP